MNISANPGLIDNKLKEKEMRRKHRDGMHRDKTRRAQKLARRTSRDPRERPMEMDSWYAFWRTLHTRVPQPSSPEGWLVGRVSERDSRLVAVTHNGAYYFIRGEDAYNCDYGDLVRFVSSKIFRGTRWAAHVTRM